MNISCWIQFFWLLNCCLFTAFFVLGDYMLMKRSILRQHTLLGGILSVQLQLSMSFLRWNRQFIGHKLYGPAYWSQSIVVAFFSYYTFPMIDICDGKISSGIASCASQAEGLRGAKEVCNWYTWATLSFCFKLWNVLFTGGSPTVYIFDIFKLFIFLFFFSFLAPVCWALFLMRW